MPSPWRRVFPLLFLVMVSLPPMGCNVVRVTLNTSVTSEDVAFIIPGETKLSEVVAKLGAPDSITDTAAGVVVTYRFLDMKYSRVNLGWLAKPWTPVDPDLIFSRTGFGVDAFEVVCDPQWIVLHRSFQRRISSPLFIPYPF